MGAAVWRFATSPVPVSGEPAVACGGGWWRVANPGKRLWASGAAVVAEALIEGGWAAVEVVEVVEVAGRARVATRAEKVRLSVSFLPLTPVATAEGWRLDVRLAVPAAALGGTQAASRAVAAVCELHGASVTGETGAGEFLVELETGVGAYYAAATAAIPDSDVLRVTVEPASCRHVDGRARP